MIFNRTALIILLVLSFSNLCAQRALLAAGGRATGTTGSVTYSIGQISYRSFNNVSGSVGQGVLQSSVLVTSIDDIQSDATCHVFPNPTSDIVVLKVENKDFRDFSFQLLDLNGKIHYSSKVTQTESSISLAELMPSVYLLEVLYKNQKVKGFKLIRN